MNAFCLEQRGRLYDVPGMALRVVIPLLLSAACVMSIIDGRDRGRLHAGAWGGEHVAMTVTDAGAHFEFDCAFGDVSKPLAADRSGSVAIEGLFVRESGGAIRQGEVPERTPARFSGHLAGDTFTFDVVLMDSNQTVGRFAATYGATPRVRKCR